jgi:eukaryotic-like serine/threonine-protein kinase
VAEVVENTVVDGRYRILNRIGSGGMADVYCAEDTHLGRQVAIKVLHRRFAQDDEFVERFRREASAAAGLQHPNVVNVFDRGRHDGTYYIAMEYLPGLTLRDVINVDAPLDQERAIAIAIQILRAAGFAHRRGVIHRDFKPHNVMLDAEDNVKVTDFGIARAGASEMTETGSIMGTAQYLSPEQAQGHAVTATSDLYSIGVILYEMLTGQVPFLGDSAVAIALKHLSEPPTRPSSIRPAIHPVLEVVVLRALAKDPAARFASAEEFIEALEDARSRVASGDGVGESTAAFAAVTAPAEPEAPPPPPPPGEERAQRRWPWIALALLLLALAAATAWALTRPEQVAVPAVEGRTLEQARTQLEQAGFEVAAERREDPAPADEVIDQDPNAGDRADDGSTVTLIVSSGPGERTVPFVGGLTQKTAIRKLNRAGFKGVEVQEESSETVRKGRVIRTDPPAGSRENPNDVRIQLYVSTGPEQVTVPNVIGLTRESAESRLDSEGLGVSFEEVDSDQPKDEVIAQDPVAGRTIDKGSRVTLKVSRGPQKAQVPDVTGLSESDARSEIRGAGLNVQARERAVDSEDDDGLVVEQRPSGGVELTKGRTVVIFVGVFEPPPEEAPQP